MSGVSVSEFRRELLAALADPVVRSEVVAIFVEACTAPEEQANPRLQELRAAVGRVAIAAVRSDRARTGDGR